MERKIDNQLLQWKNSNNRKPLLLKGARQVGKTWSLLNFGKNHYKNILYINLESNKELQAVFERNLDPGRIINELSAFTGQTVLKSETLVIFDEIQSCERAMTSLKYFQEEAPGYHLAAAGSLLGVAVNREKYSFPVGKIDFLSMYPLDFEEFMRAMGHSKSIGIIDECFRNNQACSLHETYLDLYYKFLQTGGMPEVVRTWVETGDHNKILISQQSINDAYIADMAKYATPSETVRIMAVFNSIPAQLAKENRKFQYQTIKSGARAAQFETAIDWLDAAGIITKCIKVSSGIFPMTAWKEPDYFKVYMNDTGLLGAKFGLPPSAFYREIAGYEQVKGALTENYVAGAFHTNGFETCYWESQGKAELDFVLQFRNGDVVPVEVKSSRNVRSKSLQQFVMKYHPGYSVRISTKNFGFENNIKSVPLYAVWCIKP